MRRHTLAATFIAFSLALVTTPVSAAPNARASGRQLKRRTITITDETLNTIPEIHVAGRIPTTVAFQVPLRADGILISDVNGAFPEKTPANEKSVVLLPGKDLGGKTPTTFTVTLADGTVLPFMLKSVPGEVDVQVDVVVKLDKTAPPDSAQALKRQLEEVSGELAECESTGDKAAISKIAGLIVNQDPEKPDVFERRSAHKLDKQSRLLVEVKGAYRMFKYTYAVVTVQNRDPSRPWTLDRVELGALGVSQNSDLHVETFASDRPTVGYDEVAKVVVAFKTPNQQDLNQRFYLALFEKGGSRHVRLEDLGL